MPRERGTANFGLRIEQEFLFKSAIRIPQSTGRRDAALRWH